MYYSFELRVETVRGFDSRLLFFVRRFSYKFCTAAPPFVVRLVSKGGISSAVWSPSTESSSLSIKKLITLRLLEFDVAGGSPARYLVSS